MDLRKTGRIGKVVGKAGPFPLVLTSKQRTALHIRSRLGMNREPFARMAATSVRTLASIESGKNPSPPIGRKLKEIQRVTDALLEVMEGQPIGEWLQTPNEAFGGMKPLEVVERGESDRLWQMIYRLRSGTPS